MKKKILVIALIAIFASILTMGTLAFFNANTQAANTVKMGKIDVSIVETQLASDGVTEEPYEDNKAIMPGDTVSKIVRIHNADGANEAWVRAKLTVSANGAAADASLYTLALGNGWTDGGDGYYYCNEKLAVDGVTAPLMTGVTFIGDKIGNDYANASFSVSIEAEAVQSANNGAAATQAAGWPAS